jgi:hypothetical protein
MPQARGNFDRREAGHVNGTTRHGRGNHPPHRIREKPLLFKPKVSGMVRLSEMKASHALPFLCLAFACVAQGQEAPSRPAPALRTPAPGATLETTTAPAPATRPDPELDLIPAQPGQLMPPPAPRDLGLIPGTPDSPSAPTTSKPKAEKKSRTQAVEEDLSERIRFRQVWTRVSNDPALQNDWALANRAHTDYEKREGLKKYYTKLYGRIRKLDPKLKPLADLREADAIGRITQSRVAPTQATDAAGRSTSPIMSAPSF